MIFIFYFVILSTFKILYIRIDRVFVMLIDWCVFHRILWIFVYIFRHCLIRNGRDTKRNKRQQSVYKVSTKCWKEKKIHMNTFIFIMWKQKMKYYIKLSDIKNILETNPSYYERLFHQIVLPYWNKQQIRISKLISQWLRRTA